MADTSGKTSIGQLILWPALITLAITILRLLGELRGWPHPWFNAAPGGGGAIVGISWLPIIFGPFFALRLASSGEGPSGYGKAFGLTVAGLVVIFAGGFLASRVIHSGPLSLLLVGMALMLLAAFVPWAGWRSLTRVLLAYAFAARIPVLIVMAIAMHARWGTHYDVVPPAFSNASFAQRFIYFAVLPQMMSWIGFTVIVGSLFGEIAASIFGRKQVAQTAL